MIPCLLPWTTRSFQNMSALKGKNLGKGRVAFLESVPIHLDKSQPVLQIRRDDRDNLGIISHTVIILNIGTDRSEQTVQTLIRLLLKEQSDQGLLCLLFCLHLLNTILHCKIQLFQL